MPASIRDLLSDGAWNDLVAWLPNDLDQLAAETLGFQRRRAVQSAADLVRIAMAYSVLDLSLRSVSAWCNEHRLGELSDVAVLGRLRRGWPFLRAIVERLLARQVSDAPRGDLRRRVRLIDATTLSHPGSDGADSRSAHLETDISANIGPHRTCGASTDHMTK